jgi:signal transduction histidine kinase
VRSVDDPNVDAMLARRLRRGHLIAFDVVAAVVLVLVDVLVAGNMLKDRPVFALPFLAACLAAAVLGATVAVRRRQPLPALGIALAISVIATVAGVLWDPFAAAALVLYFVAATRPPHGSVRVLLLCVAAVPAATGSAHAFDPHGSWVFTACWTAAAWLVLAAAWLIGHTSRGRRRATARLEAQRAHRIVVDERLRIARELHDVVTHGMGLIAVKAGIANHIAEKRPEEARDALRVIEATSRSALIEMRRLLGVLREETDHDPGLTPSDIAGLTELSDRVAAAGVQVELTVTDAYDLSEAMQLTVYRIVQEAVTNVVKHAAPARCRVTVSASRDGVRIEVTDDGSARPPLPYRIGGHGLVGMRERVAMYGGRFTAGPRPEGGFAVTATLPYEPEQLPAGGGA